MVELTLVLGSTSDWKNNEIDIQGQLEKVTRAHDDLTVRVDFASAHNTPDEVPRVLGAARARVSGAGMSAALPGVIEAHFTVDKSKLTGDEIMDAGQYRRVTVGIPFSDKYWKGLPAFQSIAEMPPNNPVLCAGIDNVVAGMTMAYHLERGMGRIVLARLGAPDEQYAKMKGKFEAVLGPDAMSDTSRVADVGQLKVVYSSGKREERLPKEVIGSLVVTLSNTGNVWECGAVQELDTTLAETGGVHIALSTGENIYPEDAYRFARQFSHCRATGTMAVGSVGYTNAAQFAARAVQSEAGMVNVMGTKEKKARALTDPTQAPAYVVKNGETKTERGE